MTKVAILGASRGLGRALTEHLQQLQVDHLFLSARRGEALKPTLREVDRFYSADFTNADQRQLLFGHLGEFAPQTIFSVAGGGPYGEFETKEIKDHLWSYELNLLFPARLLHFTLNEMPTVKKIIFIGSAIAENQPDPKAASYASAKHGLRGLVSTVREEQAHRPAESRVDVRLFSPGYIDTDLLPRNAHPRQRPGLKSAQEVAIELWQWSQTALD